MTVWIGVFLTTILSKFRFSHKLISLVLRCVSIDSVELLLNGSVFSKLEMKKCLRQGDPLSPFLFIIYSKLLSRLFMKLENEGRIHGIKLDRSSPAITHLMFADDVLVFCRANPNEVKEVFECLNSYCKWTGQKVHIAKSGCFFSKNINGKTKASIKKIFGINELSKDSTYLGNPLFTNKTLTQLLRLLRRWLKPSSKVGRQNYFLKLASTP